MNRARMALLAAVAVLALGGTGCRQNAGGQDMDPQPVRMDGVALVVRNENISHMDIQVVGDGIGTRIGTVPGVSTRSFIIGRSMLSASDFRIVGSPIGSSASASTGRIVVKEGETILFTIKTTLRASTVSIH